MVKLTLDKYLDEHGISRYEVSKRTGIKFQTIDGYYKNRIVRYDGYILNCICTALGCDLCDILQYIKDE